MKDILEVQLAIGDWAHGSVTDDVAPQAPLEMRSVSEFESYLVTPKQSSAADDVTVRTFSRRVEIWQHPF
jgi:hypothetical protein